MKKFSLLFQRNSHHILQLILGVVLISFVFSCQPQKTTILLSKAIGSDSYEQYIKWINSKYPDAECVNTYTLEYNEALELLEGSHGLVLTGGPDVHPGRFGREDDTVLCEIDLYRDTLEFTLIEKALEMEIPILGICRGEQLINVALGGSLVVDIPSEIDNHVIHRQEDYENCFHEITIVVGSLLNELTGLNEGIVNSNHHQAVGVLADDLKISARTSDGIVEAYEWKEPEGKPFLMAVQWHPERMKKGNLLSENILEAFMNAVKKSRNK